MWLNKWKEGVLCLSLLAGLTLMSGTASAASVTFDDALTDGGIDRFDGSGNATEGFSITGSPVVIDFIVSIAAPSGNVTGFDLTDGGVLASAVLDSDANAYVLRYSFSSDTPTTAFALAITGTASTGYSYSASVVPLPAAAWMFLSMLFGGTWLKRRGARAKGGVVATA